MRCHSLGFSSSARGDFSWPVLVGGCLCSPLMMMMMMMMMTMMKAVLAADSSTVVASLAIGCTSPDCHSIAKHEKLAIASQSMCSSSDTSIAEHSRRHRHRHRDRHKYRMIMMVVLTMMMTMLVTITMCMAMATTMLSDWSIV